MKSKVFIFAFMVLLCFGGRPVSAQSDIPRPSIDTDLWQLRNTAIPDFRYHYDDYLQYAPAAVMAGGFYNLHFAKILELQAKIMAGYAWGDGTGAGASLGAGFSLNMITGNNFRIKAFAELESMDLDKRQPWLNTVIVGFGTGWFW